MANFMATFQNRLYRLWVLLQTPAGDEERLLQAEPLIRVQDTRQRDVWPVTPHRNWVKPAMAVFGAGDMDQAVCIHIKGNCHGAFCATWPGYGVSNHCQPSERILALAASQPSHRVAPGLRSRSMSARSCICTLNSMPSAPSRKSVTSEPMNSSEISVASALFTVSGAVSDNVSRSAETAKLTDWPGAKGVCGVCAVKVPCGVAICMPLASPPKTFPLRILFRPTNSATKRFAGVR